MLSNKAFFDDIADHWDETNIVNPVKINHILDMANLHEGSRVLDVGTGTGVLTPFLSKRVGDTGHVDAIDISAAMLRHAVENHKDLANVSFDLVDVERDPIDKTYDAIFMYCMFPHLEQPLDTLRWLTRVNLSAGGKLIIAFGQSGESINGIHHHCDGSVHSTKVLPAEQFRQHLEAAGLTVDYTEDTPDIYIIRITK